MNRIRIYTTLLLLSVLTTLRGQTGTESPQISLGYPVYSQYLQNGLLINPAYAGSRGSLSAFLSYRKQWLGTTGAPTIQSLSFNTPLKNDKVGLGIMAQFMQFGVTKSKSIYADYAYMISLPNSGKLSFGLKAGADMSNTDYTGVLSTLNDKTDEVFLTNEKPYLLPNVGAGIYYFNSKLFAGFSVPAFLSYRKSAQGASPQAYHSFNDYDLLFSAGGLITFSQSFKFKPSILIDYSMQKAKKPAQLDLNANFILGDILWVGGSWRTSEQVGVGILQVQLNPQFMFGFSYDYPVGRMSSYSKGSGEVILRYEFGYKVSAANPRYF
jgi:type IX secretion system PorP/SprF family membrane protein